jgi:hypothetical protein
MQQFQDKIITEQTAEWFCNVSVFENRSGFFSFAPSCARNKSSLMLANTSAAHFCKCWPTVALPTLANVGQW